jgi:hypothetical protein
MNRLLRLSGSDPFPFLHDGGGMKPEDFTRDENKKKPPGEARRLNQFAFARSLVGELHVRGLLAAAAAVVLDLEGDLVALVEGGHA